MPKVLPSPQRVENIFRGLAETVKDAAPGSYVEVGLHAGRLVARGGRVGGGAEADVPIAEFLPVGVEIDVGLDWGGNGGSELDAYAIYWAPGSAAEPTE